MRVRLGLTSVVFQYAMSSDAGRIVSGVTVSWGRPSSTSSATASGASPAPDGPTAQDSKQALSSAPSLALDSEAAYRTQVGAMLDVFWNKIRAEFGDHRRHPLWPALVAQTAVWRQTSTAATRKAVRTEMLRAVKPKDETEWTTALTRLIDAADNGGVLVPTSVWVPASVVVLLSDLLGDCDLAAKIRIDPPGGAPVSVADAADKNRN
jgi:hypothetical protein